MVWVIAAIVSWLAIGVWAYFIERRMHRRHNWLWTVRDRTFYLFVAIFGPVALFATFSTYVDWDAPAKW